MESLDVMDLYGIGTNFITVLFKKCKHNITV